MSKQVTGSDTTSHTAKEVASLPNHQPNTLGGRMAAEDRRQQIVRVAMRIFSERGFRGTTTKEIAQAAGVSEAIIFRHFATKEDLYSAIIDHKACAGGLADMAHPVAAKIQCSVAEAIAQKDDYAVFEGIALGMMRHHDQDPDFLRLLLYSALENHQLAQMFWDQNIRLLYEFLGSYIRLRQRDGVFRDVDPAIPVRAFSGMIIHHSLNNTLWDRGRTLLDLSNEAAAREFTEILLQGIACQSAPTLAPHLKTTKRRTPKRAPVSLPLRGQRKL